MANIRDYIEENLNESFVGNVELNKIAGKAAEYATKVPSGSSLNNRLAKAGHKELATKLLQAQKMVEELRAAKKKISPLKDADTAGRRAVRSTLQRLATGLGKMVSLQAQAEKALAASKSKGEATGRVEAGKAKKKDFKEKVKENLKGKKDQRKQKVQKVVDKAKNKVKHGMAVFTTEETLEEMAKADLEGVSVSSPGALAKGYVAKYEERMEKPFDSRALGASKRVIKAFFADREEDAEFQTKVMDALKKLVKKPEEKKEEAKVGEGDE